jgi:signal transduction histidine kinase
VKLASLWDVARSRLAIRIYLVGLAQMAVVFLGFSMLSAILRPPGYSYGDREARYVVGHITDEAPAVREAELRKARDVLRASITLYDGSGHVVATNVEPPLPPPPPAHSEGFLPPLRKAHVVRSAGTSGGYAVYELPPPEPAPRRALFVLGFVLTVVGVASFLTTRALTRPLASLSAAARAFGAGQLDARANLTRRDEFGRVAAAFDDMADRVVHVLEAQRELLVNVSHELRTPLARMRVALDLAAEGDHATADEALSEIAGDVSELEGLVNDVLTASRLEKGALPLRTATTDAVSLAERAATKFRATHPEHALHVETHAAEGSVTVDPALLRRALDNVLDNAAKYTNPSAGAIDLRASSSEDAVLYEVSDRGVGISKEDLPHVFTPFFRGDRSRTRATGGAGLGLALAKRIVEAHHGALTLDSAPGVGTRVRIRIPREGFTDSHGKETRG